MKLAIMGTHSTGKTTLVNELKKHIDLPIISEVARSFPRDITDNPINEMNRQMNIFDRQLYEEDLNYKGFISDRSTIDNAAYMILALREYGYYIPINVYMDVIKNIKLATNNINKFYDYLFYIPIEFETVDDGFRNIDEVERKNIDMIIKELYDIEYIITGTIEERVKKVLEIIKC